MSIRTSGVNATKAQNKYIAKTYDRINLLVTKESGLKERIRNHAGNRNESINSFIVRAVTECLERDSKSEE